MDVIDLTQFAWPEVLLRLLLAFGLGALMGTERERRERPAGLRTHVLVTVASCLAMMMSVAMAGASGDPGRISAGVLTGLGFLGAGTILRHGSLVRGLTTAASLWAAAVVGLAVGIGWYVGALTACVLILVALTLLHWVEGLVHGLRHRSWIRVQLEPAVQFPAQLYPTMKRNGAPLMAVELHGEDEGEPNDLWLMPAPNSPLSAEAIVALVRSVPGVQTAELSAPPVSPAPARR